MNSWVNKYLAEGCLEPSDVEVQGRSFEPDDVNVPLVQLEVTLVDLVYNVEDPTPQLSEQLKDVVRAQIKEIPDCEGNNSQIRILIRA